MYDYVLRLTVMETVVALLVNCPPPGGYHHDDDDHHPHLQGVLEHGLAWHTRPISAFSILAEPLAGRARFCDSASPCIRSHLEKALNRAENQNLHMLSL